RKLVVNPRKFGFEYSAIKAAPPPNSPPAENPWTHLARTSRTGANTPMTPKVGRTPVRKVVPDIGAITRTSTSWRPIRSADGPNTKPPRGRKINAVPKAANDASSDVVSFSDGKNC